MIKHWIIAVLLFTSCAPPISDAKIATNNLPTASYTPVATLVPPTPNKRQIEIPVRTIVPTVSPQWASLAKELREKVQQAIDEKHWEDIQFKEEAYAISKRMIRTSKGKVHEDSEEILKRFRWGIEFMDTGELHEVIKILDQYN